MTDYSNYMFFSNPTQDVLKDGDRRFNITNNGGNMTTKNRGTATERISMTTPNLSAPPRSNSKGKRR